MSQFAPWVMENGLDLGKFFGELFSTTIGGFFGLDVIVSAVVLLIFASVETLRLKISGHRQILSAVFIATFVAGVSSGFPLLLYFRQRHFEKGSEMI
jgi:hypothetical protein